MYSVTKPETMSRRNGVPPLFMLYGFFGGYLDDIVGHLFVISLLLLPYEVCSLGALHWGFWNRTVVDWIIVDSFGNPRTTGTVTPGAFHWLLPPLRTWMFQAAKAATAAKKATKARLDETS